ncbi:hypothetical protein QBC36DRAFT_58417 [Triangularia setosa]|uniref:Uncharacterized protein n=1 Tax=Triangularia setosa TaxID=2587417 RepID=A0AAN7A5P3_9PEZI|nr:hypothetical protein QBC36DRAFT_58417 [Podospora setosa]
MSPILPRNRCLEITVKPRGLFGPGSDDDDDDDDDNCNPLGNWSEKSYNGPGSGSGGPGGAGLDNPFLNGEVGSEGERNNIDFDVDDRVASYQNNGIDGGKIAAIVVSVLLFFLLVTGLCFWKDRQRKKRRLAAEEQRLADEGNKGDVYMKEQGEELSPISAVSTQGVAGQAPTQGERTREQDAPPPYEPRQSGVAHLPGGQPGAGGSTWRQSRMGAEDDDIMVTDGIPPDSGRQQDRKGGGGLQIGS